MLEVTSQPSDLYHKESVSLTTHVHQDLYSYLELVVSILQ